jgi:hypothetical protein
MAPSLTKKEELDTGHGDSKAASSATANDENKEYDA